ncbi:type II toxin-antitoxin system HicA family toxin [Wansuia hejianensis]|uniref:Type II toxin-antitoxin system HicA family toxin n=1 Tax=Wansuia hejianensis TaxID=2763667 RepID=A0A7G9GB77_9FIRM|nr:type II toxin-antitoxin system HicA family toxin [Wansuia hejianensis]QNM08059.1 type II toxin-antitoxin system HicA family toxin [Wansuia hejianensis]RHV86957.1 type II toxin-antitoxin system HicA family toxin [Lachnospiraceae bacterium OF09-33XD]
MKTQELIKLLKKNKCYIIRNGSRHDIWYSEITKRQFPVPRHKAEVPIGTLNNILTDAGLRK